MKAILAVHVLGHPVNLDALASLARRFGLVLIEDAAEALGARWRDAPVGGFGDIGCFSFNGNKTVTAGGGGMVVTRSDEHARRARHLTTQAKVDPFESVHGEVGFNYRLTGLQAAVGCAQLERLEEALESKRRIAARYEDELADLRGLSFPIEAEHARSSRWLFTVRIDEAQFGCDRRSLQDALRKQGIETRPLWQPLHCSPAHRGCQSLGGVVAETLHRETLSLPSSPGLSGIDLDRVVDAIRGVHRGSRLA